MSVGGRTVSIARVLFHFVELPEEPLRSAPIPSRPRRRRHLRRTHGSRAHDHDLERGYGRHQRGARIHPHQQLTRSARRRARPSATGPHPGVGGRWRHANAAPPASARIVSSIFVGGSARMTADPFSTRTRWWECLYAHLLGWAAQSVMAGDTRRSVAQALATIRRKKLRATTTLETPQDADSTGNVSTAN